MYRAEKFVKLAPLSSRLYCWCRNRTDSAADAGRGLYRQWGIAPRPEELQSQNTLFSGKSKRFKKLYFLDK